MFGDNYTGFFLYPVNFNYVIRHDEYSRSRSQPELSGVVCDFGMVCFDILLCWKCGNILVNERWHGFSMSDVHRLRVDFKQKIVVQQNRPRVRRIGEHVFFVP